MRIICIGTSNSVIGNDGYLKALSRSHDVRNISAGRVPFYYHIKTIVDNLEEIESCDLLIVDHFVNDANHYFDRINYAHRVEFYDILSALNVNILNVLFPISKRDDGDRVSGAFKAAVDLSKERQISFADLHSIKFERHHFRDIAHLHANVSYFFGVLLDRLIQNGGLPPKPTGGRIGLNPYRTYTVEQLGGLWKGERFKNSLVDVPVASILEEFQMPLGESEELISIGYVNSNKGNQKSILKIGGSNYGLSDYGYFHEMIDRTSVGTIGIAPAEENVIMLEQMQGRGPLRGPFEIPQVSDFLTRDTSKTLSVTPAQRIRFDCDFSQLLECAERAGANNTLPSMSEKTIDKVRDLAFSLENVDIRAAFELMTLASIARPNGPVIRQKVVEYKRKLTNHQNAKS